MALLSSIFCMTAVILVSLSSPAHSCSIYPAMALVASTTVNYDHIFKIILIGDNSVGKSSFIRRFCEGTFVADMESTIGVDFYLSEIAVNGKKIKVSSIDKCELQTDIPCTVYTLNSAAFIVHAYCLQCQLPDY